MTISTYPPLEEIFPALKMSLENREARSLKDDVKSDLAKGAAWFNDLELAGYHTVNGGKILCVFDKYDAAFAARDSGRSTDKGAVVMAGLQSDLYLLFIRADEYGGTPRIGQEITVDCRKFFIREFVDYEGVFEITLKAGAAR
ncbi:MAG: hypothetical protein LBS53_14840 [Synergistaceae bacterium]|jgi:hypothetical protein|nr:hypothetical protein [Synergistaceae bacterium]